MYIKIFQTVYTFSYIVYIQYIYNIYIRIEKYICRSWNSPTHADASCQRSPDRAARVGDECHETLKTGRKCYMNCIYKYMSGIYMVYTWHILMYDESRWWLLTYIGCIPIYLLYICYIHGIYMVYTSFVSFLDMKQILLCFILGYVIVE